MTAAPRTLDHPAPPWQEPAVIRRLLGETETWAVVGLSGNPDRTATRIAAFLQRMGKRIVPVHPDAPTVHGEPGYASLADVPFARAAEAGLPMVMDTCPVMEWPRYGP